MICTTEQIENIIKLNPQKDLVKQAKEQSDKLMMLIHGHGLTSAIIQDAYFESNDVFASRNKNAISNKDLFGRLFQREEMVFTAQGGAAYYIGLSKEQSIMLNAKLDSIRFSLSLRGWIKQFALPAFRCDPMGVIFIESDKNRDVYPTYKSVASVYDYLPNGRKLEYICFRLTKAETVIFEIQDETLNEQKPDFVTNYYRLVDDAHDGIYKYENSVVTEINTIPHAWEQTPAFIISDIISFENVHKFLSPVSIIVELANCFLNDRSIRDLQKKYHGFLKAIEPLLQCGICEGSGYLSGAACPECTPMGADKGTGYKLRTKVADVARFPLSALKEGFDFKKIWGYIQPLIETWNKQDESLNQIENLINDVYWGTDSRKAITVPKVGDISIKETATKTLANLQPIYARLNMTADWAQNTENMIADFIGQYMFDSFKKSQITYGRYYILETPSELMDEYLEMKAKGASQSSLFAALKKFIHSAYCTDASQLAVELKMINVEPFVHSTISEVQANNPAKIDYLSKLYFSEWRQLQGFDYLLATKEDALRQSLNKFATNKASMIPEQTVVSVGVNERVTT